MYISKYRQTDNYSFHWAQSGRGPRGDWSSPLLLDTKYLVISDQSERGLGMLLSFLSRPSYCPVRGVVWPLGWPLITIWESPLLSINYMTPISSATLYAAQRRAVICDGLNNELFHVYIYTFPSIDTQALMQLKILLLNFHPEFR